MGSIPGLGRSPGEGHGNSLQDSCLENPKDRGAWRAPVYRVKKSPTDYSDFSEVRVGGALEFDFLALASLTKTWSIISELYSFQKPFIFLELSLLVGLLTL